MNRSRVARLVIASVFLTLNGLIDGQDTTTSNPKAAPTSGAGKLAPFAQRLAAAKSVKVQDNILGLQPGMPLERAHAKLDPLVDPSKPVKTEAGEAGEAENDREGEESKTVWQLAKTDFSAIYVKANAKEEITYLMGLLRPEAKLPFTRIGEVEKAPIRSDSTVAWDVVRPKRPLIRVIARGSNGEASSIIIFVVKPSAAKR